MPVVLTDPPALTRAPAALEAALEALEQPLAALGAALREHNAAGVERHAAELHRALAVAVQRFGPAARENQGLPSAGRQRLTRASVEVAAQREGLARASAAIERALAVLMPAPQPAAVYGTGGQNARAATSGCLHA
jgi:hypothetical protein